MSKIYDNRIIYEKLMIILMATEQEEERLLSERKIPAEFDINRSEKNIDKNISIMDRYSDSLKIDLDALSERKEK